MNSYSKIQFFFQVGQLIALTVEEGEDWQDVQIPAQKKSAPPKDAEQQPKEVATPVQTDADVSKIQGEHHFEDLARTGPAVAFLLAQYGIKSR